MLFFIHFNYTEKQIINNMIQQNFMKMIFSNIYDIKHKPFLYLIFHMLSPGSTLMTANFN